MPDNTTGYWIDKDSGQLVQKRPARGRQIAAPGRPPTAAERAALERLTEQPAPAAPAEPAEVPDEPAAVDAPAAPAKKAPAKKAPAKK